MDVLTHLLEHYGYGLIFLFLCLEMLALPLPGEMLMSYIGLSVYEHKLNWFSSIVAGGLGAIAGVTLSYWIGYRLGRPFIEKHGERVHLGPDQMNRLNVWFEKYGDKLLIIAYFIPGVRHITGYFSGVTRLSFRRYVIFAYSGAFLWVGLFISLGKVLGPKWEEYHSTVNRYMVIFGIASALLTLLIYVYRKYKRTVVEMSMNLIRQGVRRYHSFGKVRFLILASFSAFVISFSLMLGVIQDFLAHEFGQFDEIAGFIVTSIFGPQWRPQMHVLGMLGSSYLYLPALALAAFWILKHSKEQRLDLGFLVWVVVGAEWLDAVLRLVFHRPGPATSGIRLLNTFPSEAAFNTLTIYGFTAFLMLRYYRNPYLRLALLAGIPLICLGVGLSRVYDGMQYPSDIFAGYVFGGVWLSLNIMLLEILRKFRNTYVKSGVEPMW